MTPSLSIPLLLQPRSTESFLDIPSCCRMFRRVQRHAEFHDVSLTLRTYRTAMAKFRQLARIVYSSMRTKSTFSASARDPPLPTEDYEQCALGSALPTLRFWQRLLRRVARAISIFLMKLGIKIVINDTRAVKLFPTSVSLQHEPKANAAITRVSKSLIVRASHEILLDTV